MTGSTPQLARHSRSFAARAAFWSLIFTVAGVPLVLLPGIQYFDITPKLLLVVTGASLVCLLLAVDGVAWRSVWQRPADKRAAEARDEARSGGWVDADAPAGDSGWATPRWFALATGACAGCAVLSAVFSTNRLLSLAGSEWRRMGLPAWLACLALAFAALVFARSERDRRRIAAAMALSAAAAGCYALAQYGGFDPWINPRLYHIGEGVWRTVRPPSTLGYVSYFANFALIGGFLALGLGLSARKRAVQAAWLAAAFVIALAVLASGARAAFVGIVAGVIVLAAFRERRKLLLGGLLVCVIVVAALVASPLGQPIRSRMRWFVEDPGGGHRLLIWRDSLRLVGAHPLLGAGPDGYGLEFLQFESLDLAEALPDRYVESSHNVLLDYASTAGVPALACFLALMVIATGAALPRIRGRGGAPTAERAFEQAAFAGLVAGAVAAVFVADTIATRLVLLVTAAILCVRPGTESEESARADLCPTPLPIRATMAVATTAALALALFAGQRMLRADAATAAAARAAASRHYEALLNEARTASAAFPWTSSYAFACSRMLGEAVIDPRAAPGVRRALLDAAEASAQSVVSASDQPHLLYVHLASLYVMEGRARDAERMLERAIAVAPSWYRPHWLLAALLSAEGRRFEAAAHAEAALERGARSHSDIAAQCRTISQLYRPRQ